MSELPPWQTKEYKEIPPWDLVEGELFFWRGKWGNTVSPVIFLSKEEVKSRSGAKEINIQVRDFFSTKTYTVQWYILPSKSDGSPAGFYVVGCMHGVDAGRDRLSDMRNSLEELSLNVIKLEQALDNIPANE